MKYISILIIALFGLLSSCKDEPIEVPEPEVNEMQVNISHTFSSEELIFFNKDYTIASEEKISLKRFAYLLGDFYLVKNDDTKVYLTDQYALIVPSSNQNSYVLKDIFMGDYKAIGFSLGLDSAVNQGNPNQYATDHPLSPINNSMHWSWAGGYIFTALEGNLSGTTDNFVFHLAGSENKIDYEFPLTFNKGMKKLKAEFNYDLSEVFKNPSNFSMANDGMSTHSTSDPVTLKLFANMKDVFTLNEITAATE
jgi:hypothetical protein